MKFLNPRQPKGHNGNDLVESSPATTAVASPDPSLSNGEKGDVGNATSSEAPTTYAGHGEKRIVEVTPMEEAAALDKLSDELEYPSGLKLVVIMIALCLSVFLVALVSTLETTYFPHIQQSNGRLWYSLLADLVSSCRITPS